MPVESPQKPVTDSVPKVNHEIAVGSDLEFQRRWWKFEGWVWAVFTTLIILTGIGCLGRGPLAKAHVRAADGSMELRYERIARFRTPSVITATFSPDAVHDGRVRLWASEDLVRRLGAESVIPQPAESALSSGGIAYTFPAAAAPYQVVFSLRPSAPGFHRVWFRVAGKQPIELKTFVMP